jgi:hypothetical protein
MALIYSNVVPVVKHSKHTYAYIGQTKRFPGLSKSETSHPLIKTFVTNNHFLDRHRRRSTSSPRFVQAWQRDHDPFYGAYELLIGQSLDPFSAHVGRRNINEPTVPIDAFYSEYRTNNAIPFEHLRRIFIIVDDLKTFDLCVNYIFSFMVRLI